MQTIARSIRPFIGAKDFVLARQFYLDLGFEEVVLEPRLSLLKSSTIAFYLQDAYVKDWIDNTMIFVEVENLDDAWKDMASRKLSEKYPAVRLDPIKSYAWGRECFLHDPSGILWHFGEFAK